MNRRSEVKRREPNRGNTYRPLNNTGSGHLLFAEFVELRNVESLKPVQIEAPDVESQSIVSEVNVDVTQMSSYISVESGRNQTTEEVSIVYTDSLVPQINVSDRDNGRSQPTDAEICVKALSWKSQSTLSDAVNGRSHAARGLWRKLDADVEEGDVNVNLHVSQETQQVSQESSYLAAIVLMWTLLLTCLYPIMKCQTALNYRVIGSVEPTHYTVMPVKEKKPPDPDTVQGAETLYLKSCTLYATVVTRCMLY